MKYEVCNIVDRISNSCWPSSLKLECKLPILAEITIINRLVVVEEFNIPFTYIGTGFILGYILFSKCQEQFQTNPK